MAQYILYDNFISTEIFVHQSYVMVKMSASKFFCMRPILHFDESINVNFSSSGKHSNSSNWTQYKYCLRGSLEVKSQHRTVDRDMIVGDNLTIWSGHAQI